MVSSWNTMRKFLVELFQDLKFFLKIYTWLEVWYVIGGASAIVGCWFVIAFALSLPNPFRAALIWGLFLALFVLVPKALTSLSKAE
jgi:hypothetical protein